MGFIRERKLKDGGVRFQAEVRLKGHPMITAAFDRKTDAKAWVQKTEADLRCNRYQLYADRRRHTLKEAVERYLKEHKTSQAKQGHLQWWVGRLEMRKELSYSRSMGLMNRARMKNSSR